MVDGLQQEYQGRMDFDVHYDLNADPVGSGLASDHGVSAVPTMMISAADGREVKRWVGAVSVEELREAFDDALR